MTALVVGTLLAVATLAYVLFPLLFGTAVPFARRDQAMEKVNPASEHDAVVALREIEFDRVTGKLSDSDYAELKTRYTERALSAMRATAADPAQVEDLVEATVLAYRARLKSCQRCGPRPEPDAEYCSSCGAFLAGSCAGCGRAVEEAGAAFCSGCGRQLAA
ncbi:MAG: zinc ribbon domain-containing protein [Gemmatimonadaceae bacterium]